MRCDVLLTQDPKAVYPDAVNTDIEIWREGSSYKKALMSSGPRDMTKYVMKEGMRQLQKSVMSTKVQKHCQKSEAPGNANGKIYVF